MARGRRGGGGFWRLLGCPAAAWEAGPRRFARSPPALRARRGPCAGSRRCRCGCARASPSRAAGPSAWARQFNAGQNPGGPSRDQQQGARDDQPGDASKPILGVQTQICRLPSGNRGISSRRRCNGFGDFWKYRMQRADGELPGDRHVPAARRLDTKRCGRAGHGASGTKNGGSGKEGGDGRPGRGGGEKGRRHASRLDVATPVFWRRLGC